MHIALAKNYRSACFS